MIVWDESSVVANTLLKSNMTRIRKGWGGEGRVGFILGPPIWVEQWWTPILFEDEEDPTFHKTAGLEIPYPPEPSDRILRRK